MNAEDALKYAAATLKSRTDWACDAIGGSLCNGDHEIETGAILDTVTEIRALAAKFGDPRRYSDGRLVESSKEIVSGITTAHVWHPDVASEPVQSFRGDLPSGDPGLPSPGVYEVTATPATQDLHVRVVRVAGCVMGVFDPMPVAVHFDETSTPALPQVNVAFTGLSGSVAFVLTLSQIDELVEQLSAARNAFDEDEHVGKSGGA